jgi:chaperonin GroES
MNVKPLFDLVIVRREKSEEVTPGGLIIPPTAQKNSTVGYVVAVGPGRILENGLRVVPEVKVGDKIIIGEWSGQEIDIDGEKCLIMKEELINGVVEK